MQAENKEKLCEWKHRSGNSCGKKAYESEYGILCKYHIRQRRYQERKRKREKPEEKQYESDDAIPAAVVNPGDLEEENEEEEESEIEVPILDLSDPPSTLSSSFAVEDEPDTNNLFEEEKEEEEQNMFGMDVYFRLSYYSLIYGGLKDFAGCDKDKACQIVTAIDNDYTNTALTALTKKTMRYLPDPEKEPMKALLYVTFATVATVYAQELSKKPYFSSDDISHEDDDEVEEEEMDSDEY